MPNTVEVSGDKTTQEMSNENIKPSTPSIDFQNYPFPMVNPTSLPLTLNNLNLTHAYNKYLGELHSAAAAAYFPFQQINAFNTNNGLPNAQYLQNGLTLNNDLFGRSNTPSLSSGNTSRESGGSVLTVEDMRSSTPTPMSAMQSPTIYVNDMTPLAYGFPNQQFNTLATQSMDSVCNVQYQTVTVPVQVPVQIPIQLSMALSNPLAAPQPIPFFIPINMAQSSDNDKKKSKQKKYF